MNSQKYSVNQHLIETLLSWVKSGEIAIPEIQRPFVWDASKVRDLMDSLYQGFPVGYVIAWRNPNIRLKDGSFSEGKKILIDGQQRVTALKAAILGDYVVNKHYERVKIKIAFHPIDERFEVQNPAILKDRSWLPDISEFFTSGTNSFHVINEYLTKNPEAEQQKIIESIGNLFNLAKKQIGLIELSPELDIETVTEIFIRINSQGVVLSQADFAMSKIAANESYGGQYLRKAIDYFCHLAVSPEFFQHIQDNDPEFAKSDYFQKMAWLRDETDELYDPTYNDMLRVSFGTEFNRAKLGDLVSLLSGRNFETRTFEENIAADSFAQLKTGVLKFMNETHFKRFIMILKSAGFVIPEMIRSKNAINFAYMLYLKLRDKGETAATIESYVKRWFVLSILTQRSTGSFESQFDYDIKQIAEHPFGEYLANTEAAVLSDSFWEVALPQQLTTSSVSSPFFYVFLASQIAAGEKGFLSRDISVRELVEHRGDVHHIFPKEFLKKQGLQRGDYNQIANFVFMQSEINIQIGNKAPTDYFAELLHQCTIGEPRYGNITDEKTLQKNLAVHCIPDSIYHPEKNDYEGFLKDRRRLMAARIRQYYLGL
ncbi:MAG TPA: DUF262 domain-containing protein [Saprospiraceae bacterium]|nr:DUF262 domain-containing protein [Saprospiraceae bacterium]